MIGIAKNVAREEIRKRQNLAADLLGESAFENHPLDEPGAEAALDSREKMELLVQAISNLPPQCRRVFIMKHVQGASHKEISSRLGISVRTVDNHVAAGLTACRNQILAKLNDTPTESDVKFIFGD